MKLPRSFHKTLIGSALIASSTLCATFASADQVESYPSAWLLQDYLDGNITLFYTGSTCGSGSMVLTSSSSAESRARLWSVLLTAVTTHRKVGIYYTNNSGQCYINNFYLPPSQ